jgi:O-methyltransferase
MNSISLEKTNAAALYLDLMKRVLTDSIFIDHPMAHVVPHRIKTGTPWIKRQVLNGLAGFLARYQITLVEPGDSLTQEQRVAAVAGGTSWPLRAHSMIGMKRLNNLQFCVESVLGQSIPGDLIETGVWRGGACIFMRAILAAHGDQGRSVWVADSFSGLPPPSEGYEADAGDLHHTFENLAVSLEEVQFNFRRYNLLDERVRFLKGWFRDTLSTAPIDRLAVLRLDGDMYESTIQALDALYDKVSPGGFIIIDDYYLKPCAQAVHDFRRSKRIDDTIIDIDGIGSYWRRSS